MIDRRRRTILVTFAAAGLYSSLRPATVPIYLQRDPILEEGMPTYPDAGTPQGGVISPLLANVYLHYVLHQWFHQDVLPRLRGRAMLIRYADDFVIGFTDEADARRVLEVLPKRFRKYGLTINPEKTRLVPFHTPRGPEQSSSHGGPGTCGFLGFTHYWARSRKGDWVIKQKTATSRFTRAVREISTRVSTESTSTSCRAASHVVPETARPLQLLRNHGQQPLAGPLPTRSDRTVVQMATASE